MTLEFPKAADRKRSASPLRFTYLESITIFPPTKCLQRLASLRLRSQVSTRVKAEAPGAQYLDTHNPYIYTTLKLSTCLNHGTLVPLSPPSTAGTISSKCSWVLQYFAVRTYLKYKLGLSIYTDRYIFNGIYNMKPKRQEGTVIF